MVLSFHPCYAGDVFRLCAGRDPDEEDRAAVERADAVILPQGCRPSLYALAAAHCPNVFPDYRVRFDFPGKIGQTRLFRTAGAPHPETVTVDTLEAFRALSATNQIPPYPFVFKFDWGGEGETVFRVSTTEDFNRLIARAEAAERTGQAGFLLQKIIPSGGRTLRVAAIGRKRISYWRVQADPRRFVVNLAGGGCIDRRGDPGFQAAARKAVDRLCERTGINLAGFDLLCPEGADGPEPLFLEINWFFGRRGLGGSKGFYRLLTREIDRWLAGLGLAPGTGPAGAPER